MLKCLNTNIHDLETLIWVKIVGMGQFSGRFINISEMAGTAFAAQLLFLTPLLPLPFVNLTWATGNKARGSFSLLYLETFLGHNSVTPNKDTKQQPETWHCGLTP